MTRGQKTTAALLVVCHFVLLYLVLNRTLDFLFNDAAHRIGPGSDFWAMYNAGKHWRLGNTVYLQGPGYGFRYHPIFAMTGLAWISLLTHTAAYGLWVAINELLFLTIIPFIRRSVENTRHFLVVLALLVFFTPYYLEVYMGNASFVAAALLLVAFYYFERGRYLRFFPLYLTSILVKPLGLLFLPVLLARRQYRLTILTVIIFIGSGLPYFFMHPDDWHSFISVNFDGFPADPGFLVHAGNQGFYALILLISCFANNIATGSFYTLKQLPAWNMIVVRLIPYALIILSLWATLRLRRRPPIYTLLFVWSAAYLLGYKDVWEHSYSFLILGLFCLYLSGEINRRLLLALSVGIALPTAFALYDIHFYGGAFNDPGWHWSFPVSLLHHLTKPIWLVVLYAIVAKLVWRREAALSPTAGGPR
jgi:hypothetical protein